MNDPEPLPRLHRAPRSAPCERKTVRILLGEDDEEMRALLRFALRRAGYEVVDCADGGCLAEHVSSSVLLEEEPSFDLVISDLRLPGLSGLAIMEALNSLPGAPPLILITAFGDAATHARADALGVAAMFDKPFELDVLLDEVARLVHPADTAA